MFKRKLETPNMSFSSRRSLVKTAAEAERQKVDESCVECVALKAYHQIFGPTENRFAKLLKMQIWGKRPKSNVKMHFVSGIERPQANWGAVYQMWEIWLKINHRRLSLPLFSAVNALVASVIGLHANRPGYTLLLNWLKGRALYDDKSPVSDT